jgi:hypothetical protein
MMNVEHVGVEIHEHGSCQLGLLPLTVTNTTSGLQPTNMHTFSESRTYLISLDLSEIVGTTLMWQSMLVLSLPRPSKPSSAHRTSRARLSRSAESQPTPSSSSSQAWMTVGFPPMHLVVPVPLVVIATSLLQYSSATSLFQCHLVVPVFQCHFVNQLVTENPSAGYTS